MERFLTRTNCYFFKVPLHLTLFSVEAAAAVNNVI